MTPPKHRAAFYRTLSQLLAAGAQVQIAMESAIAHLPRRDRAQANATIPACLARGEPVSQALAASRLFPADHLRFLGLAEQSGHLDPLLRELADFTEEVIALRGVVVSGLALPVVYLAITAFLGPLPALFAGGSVFAYLVSSVGFLALVALGAGALVLGFKRAPGALLDRVLRPLPFLGATWREWDYWHLTRTLALLSRTSIGVIPAVRQAADTCRSPRLATTLRTASDQAETRGVPLSPLLRATGELPVEMMALWQTGEQTGRLDETFQRLAVLFAERSRRRLAELTRWTPRLVYFLVAAYMVLQIVHLARGYLDTLNEILAT